MLRTILILLSTLILIPISAIFFDIPLNSLQWEITKSLIVIYILVALGCFIISELTQNYSQVDKLWSLMPIIYTWYVAQVCNFDSRLTLMAITAAIWGIRLTFNFGRKGGYSIVPWRGAEDYRWAILRKQPMLSSRFAWAFFNLFFISLYQQGLILLFTLPTIIAIEGTGVPLGWPDYVITFLILGLVIIETIADQQQYNFQTEKHRRIKTGEPLGEFAQGFIQTGLWSKSRHPNFAAEQLIWLVFYFYSVAATGRILNWTLAGSILLMLLFLGSSDFTEKISAGKYPEYAKYKKRVKRFFLF